MREEAHEQLIRDTTRLRSKLARASSMSVIGSVVAHHIRRAHEEDYESGLVSPARQAAFLFALMLSTPEPADPTEFKSSDWDECVDLLDRIFRSYQDVMWPTPTELDELGRPGEEWLKVREVAGQALLHYHNTGLMATVDQIKERVAAYVAPFDAVLEEKWGVSATQALEICDWIGSRWEDHQDRLAATVLREKEERLKLIDHWEKEGLDLEAFREYVSTTEYSHLATELFELLNTIATIERADLVARWDSAGEAFWERFSIRRGTVSITYPTEANPFDQRPLMMLSSDTAMTDSLNSIYLGVLNASEADLEASRQVDAYRRNRDKTLESQTAAVARVIFGNEATYLESVYETSDSRDEHDLVVVIGRSVVVFESKASPPKEPFRDPDRAFVRLQRAFGSDRGIQKAYEQGDRVRDRLARGEVVRLFDQGGTEVYALDPASVDDVLVVCVTRDDFGPVAVDLSLLLERPSETSPYPWAVDILNLQSLGTTWHYFGLRPDDFLRFLRQRERLQGRTICWDELDIAGSFLRHGGLQHLVESDADRVHLSPHYADIFDEVQAAIAGAGPPVELEVTEPFVADAREMLTEMLGQLAAAKRNDPCPCGSGKKFKKCHGKVT